jgi:hypothetical protein
MNSADPITKKARVVFDQAVDSLDIATINRLRLMRRDTLTSTQAKHRDVSALKRWWLPVAGISALALVLSINVLLMPQKNDLSFAEYDSALILSEDDTDAEMLAWLADAPVDVSMVKGKL